MSLRIRLLIGLLALAAVGLGVAGAVTYHEQKSFLNKRVNEQLAAALAVPDQIVVGGPSEGEAQLLPFGTYAEVRYPTGQVKPLTDTCWATEYPSLPSAVESGERFTVHDPTYKVAVGPVSVNGRPALLVVAIPMKDVSDALHRLLFIEIVVAVLVLLALASVAWLVVKLGLRPLEQMQETAGAIAAGDLSRRVEVVDETTEVGKLGIALNEMLSQIETAFDERSASEERLRRFVGDASHELRTPLTSIRGYAELFRRGAAERPEDLAKAMRRIEEEADRMGVLVDDLLLLARLDQGRPLERTPVDLTRIASDAVDDLRTVAPTHPVDFSPNGSIFVPGDDVRLRQVLANLLQNANKHTPPDTPIHVHVGTEGDEAVIVVADEGPGMEPEDAQRVFERFWRADPSRTRASGGVGLGLSIVSAIAEAHGGRAEVESSPGHGATFRVRLPVTIPAATAEPEASDGAPPTTTTLPEITIAELEETN